ncbi:hypothetical protein AABB24_012465 [Solanum stoloniferum]|uniref:Uncharacterized protein n=1 Tax=Solanum stoloniferum TaxID=62892 RepID=A0ABD2U313_9SOLN
MILPTDEEMIRCFVRCLRTQLRVETYSLVIAGYSFLDIVDHTRSIEQFHREAQGGNDKRALHEGSYNGPYYRFGDYQGRPQQQFQQGKASRPVEASLQASGDDQHQQGASIQGDPPYIAIQRVRDVALAASSQTSSSHSAGQSTRASDVGTTSHSGQYFVGQSS